MKIENVEERIANLHDTPEYVIHILVLKNVHRVTKFNQKPWLKPYIDTNIDLSKAAIK